MLDQKLIRENPTSVEENLSLRGKLYNISQIQELTVKKKKLIQKYQAFNLRVKN